MNDTTSEYIDFPALKERVSLHQAMQYLNLKLTLHGSQFRGSCPVHGGDHKAFVVTPGKGFYCFVEKKGGDQIQLVAHVKQIANRAAALDLLAYFGDKPVRPMPAPSPQPASTMQSRELKPLDYLQCTEAVEGLGISEDTCKDWGAGFANKGIMRGRFAVPIHGIDGTLLAYVGIAVSPEQSPRYHFPNGFDPHSVIFGAHRINGEEVRLVADVLQVLGAHQAGEQAICFLTDIVEPQQFETLAAIQDEKKCKVFF